LLADVPILADIPSIGNTLFQDYSIIFQLTAYNNSLKGVCTILGAYLKQIREEKRLSTREVEQLCEVNASFLSQIERNKKKPGPDTLRKLSHAYLVPHDKLMAMAGYVNTDNAMAEDTEAFVAVVKDIESKLDELKNIVLRINSRKQD
jgi:transcriptional regulator with XRE-family HTH domain